MCFFNGYFTKQINTSRLKEQTSSICFSLNQCVYLFNLESGSESSFLVESSAEPCFASFLIIYFIFIYYVKIRYELSWKS